MSDSAASTASPPPADTVRNEPNRRWIRGRIGGRTVVDSRNSLFVWEMPYYPQWYFPRADVHPELRRTERTEPSDALGPATVFDLVISEDGGEVVHEGAALIYEDAPVEAIRDRVRLRWDAVDTWLEEEVEVAVHPRSPYTRVDALPSSRRVVVTVDGEVVAETDRPTILYETGLRPRYYLPMEDVRPGLLTPSDSSTACPYKGVARYWDLTVNGETHRDLVWGYDNPLPESAPVTGLVCFYNERVTITVDGEPAPTS
ncbi:MAG: DUF427 domain-containing protein [Actinomycetota bacterium]